MGDVFEAWRDDQRVRPVIVRGAGDKSFSSGNDISELTQLRSILAEIGDYSNITERAYTFLKTFPKPTIARIAGYCIGGGLEVSQLCDIQIASESATFGITPAKLGLGYKFEDVSLLIENIPSKVAKELLTRSFAKSIIETIEFPEVVKDLNCTLLKKLEVRNV